MTRQDVIDRLHQWFVVDKNPKSQGMVDGKPECRYRLDPGEVDSPRCAVGLFMSDKLYAAEVSTMGTEKSLYNLLNYNLKVEKELVLTDLVNEPYSGVYNFWACIRYVHDSAEDSDFTASFDEKLKGFARSENLVYPGG